MANRYCNFTGNQKIKDTYDLIPKGFDRVQSDVDVCNAKAKNIQDQVDALVVDGDSSPAIAQALAGTGFSTLKEYNDDVNSQLAEKANKDEVTNVMTPKGNIAYASLPITGNEVGWYYYCPDGDGTHGAGNYVWNGASWFFGGTGDEGYNLLKKDTQELLKSYNQVNSKNIYHIFRIVGSNISNAVLKKYPETPYYCVLIDATVNKSFTISHTDTGIENGYRQFKAVAVDVTIKDMLAWGENEGVSADHMQWIFAETGEYVQTKNVTISDNMKTLVVQFSKDILPEYMEILVGTFETQQFANYREGIIPIGYVYSKTEADEKFLNKTEADEKFLNKTEADEKFLNKTEADEKFLNKTEADEYTKMKQTYALSNGRLTVCVGKSKFWIERRNDSYINLDTWLIRSMYINDVVVMAGTDIEGPIKQVGTDDFTGGIHGDEKFTSVKVLVNGNIIDLTTTISEKPFNKLDIFVESVIYFCNTSNVAFNRCKHISFERGKTTISNSLTYVGVDDYSVYRWCASGCFSIYKDLMLGYATNTDCKYITDSGKLNDKYFDEITFYGNNYTAKIKALSKKYESYVGFVQDFSAESRPRFKVYFDTVNDYNGEVILKNGEKLFASYEIEVI